MARLRWCDETKEFLELDEWHRRRASRAVNSAPMVISDGMDPTLHPCDGRLYDSKSTFRAVTRQNGCVEVGNDKGYFNGGQREMAGDFNVRGDLGRATYEVLNRRR